MKKASKISLICPLLHISALKDCYDIWENTKLPFEIIFLGPEELSIDIPNNAIYIQTKVKPIQVCSYGAHVSSGELLMLIADDIIVPQNIDVLTTLYEKWLEYKNYKCILSLSASYVWANHWKAGKFLSIEDAKKNIIYNVLDENKNWEATEIIHRYRYEKAGALLPMCGLISKKFYIETGGFDNRFLGPQAAEELAYRAINVFGGDLKFSNIPWYEVKNMDWVNSSYSKLHDSAISLRYHICENEKNLSPHLFEINDTILTKNQGTFHKNWPGLDI